MCDDIDIEEHDVLENPTIKKIFPDITVIKKEINQYYEEDAVSDTTSKAICDKIFDPHSNNEHQESLNFKENKLGEVLHHQHQESLSFKENKLGEVQHQQHQESLNFKENKLSEVLPDNIIILGSKPETQKKEYHYEEKQEPKVILDNLSLFLDKCKRYCKLCLRLFPKVCMYNLHMHIVHTTKHGQFKPKQLKHSTGKVSKKIYNCNSCDFSNSSKYSLKCHINKVHGIVSKTVETNSINVNRVSNVLEANEPAQGHSCFHCNVIFQSQSSLIEHLYEVLKPVEPSKNENSKNDQQMDVNMDEQNVVSKERRKCFIESVEKNKLCILEERINQNTLTNPVNKCYICSAQFNTVGKLKYHKKIVHKQSISRFYQCFICSKYTELFKFYSMHMKVNHNIEDIIDIGKVPFDSQCKHCSKKLSNVTIYNKHLSNFHRKLLKKVVHHPYSRNKFKEHSNYIIRFALKSVLYKCTQCNLFFLSALIALEHSKHESNSNNWKCSTCNRMFSTTDKQLHLKQHSFHQNFTVYNLNKSLYAQLLYKCSQCTIHYSEVSFFEHSPNCDSEPPKSVYCKNCDILVNSNDMDFHQLNHICKNLKSIDFIIIESDIIEKRIEENEDVKNTENNKNILIESDVQKTSYVIAFCSTCQCFLYNVLSIALKIHFEGKCANMFKRVCTDCGLMLTMNSYQKHKLFHENQHFTLQNFSFYDLKTKSPISPPIPVYPSCNTCGIHFITKTDIQAHRCHTKEYKTCSICLRKFNDEAYGLHLSLHKHFAKEMDNELKIPHLQTRYDSLAKLSHSDNSNLARSKPKKNNKSLKKNKNNKTFDHDSNFIFMFCDTCKCFVSNYHTRKAHLERRCGNIPNLICQQCGLLMTWKTHATHKALHKKMQINIQQYSFYSLESNRQIRPPIPDYPNCDVCGVHFLRKNLIRTHMCLLQEYKTCDICMIKLTKQAYKLHMGFHNYSIKNIDRNLNPVTEIMTPANQVPEIVSENKDSTNYDDSKTSFLFLCKSCQITFTSYDNVVQHCQDHYNYKVINLKIQKCNNCNITLYRIDYDKHIKLHSNGMFDIESLTVVDFDPFYFRYSCDFWTKHIFSYVADDQITNILNNSMYKYECRLKMEECQSGSSRITLYKCDKCQSFIEPQSLFTHVKISKNQSCVNLRKHACSICSLEFFSMTYKLSHEKEHEVADINIKTCRIITFNTVEDIFNQTIFDAGKRFILYQCRNCGSAVDKFQRINHQCEENNLKKCLKCNLLLLSKHFELHFIRHEELEDFTKENITIVMFGKTNSNENKDINCTFTGSVFDYVFYRCNKCNICIRSNSCPPGHVCVNGQNMCVCGKCGLRFLKRDMQHHSKLHESEYHFDELNVSIIPFDASCTKPTSENEVHDDLSKQIKNDESNNIMQNQINSGQKFDKMYKCICGLHFLEESNAQVHANNCNIKGKISKQSCLKCDLLFTPGELFNHLLKHHCDKTLQYKFDIVIVYKINTEESK